MVTDFLKLFAVRRECFDELRRLSEEQHELIAQDDYSSLLALQGNKLRVIGQLEAVTAQFPQLMRDWKAQRDQLPHDTRLKCDATLAETEHLLAGLLEQERNDTQTISDRRDETRRQLYGLSSGVRAQQAYAGDRNVANHRVLDIGQ